MTSPSQHRQQPQPQIYQPPRILTNPTKILTLLQNTLTLSTTQKTTLLFCTTRPSLLSTLKSQIETWVPPREEIPASQESDVELDLDLNPGSNVNVNIDDPGGGGGGDGDESRAKHPLTTPTLHNLSRSRHVQVVFVPSIAVFRAWIATFVPGHTVLGQQRLIIIDLLTLHDGTSEFTVQGLSRSFAAVVELAFRCRCGSGSGAGSGLSVEIVECGIGIGIGTDGGREYEHEHRVGDREGVGTGMDGNLNPEGGSGNRSGNERERTLWDAEVPLLNRSVRIGGDAGGWVGRTVPVRRVVERWFEVVD